MTTQKFCILCHTAIWSTGYLGITGDDDMSGLNPELSVASTSSLKSSQGLGKVNEDEDIQLISNFYRAIQISGLKSEGRGGNGDMEYHDQLSICGACRPVLISTMERKVVLDEVEDNVRKIQLELLKELNKLKGLVHQFYDDMKGVEERIGCGDQSQYTSFGSPLNSCEVDLFERRIRKVVKDLSSCQVGRLQIPEDKCHDELVSPKPPSPPSSLSAPSYQESDNDFVHPSNGQDSSGNEISDDSSIEDDDLTKKSKPPSKILIIIRKPALHSVGGSSHALCKTHVINNVLLRKERILSGQPLPRKPCERTDVKDPRDSYYIDYDPATDSFSLDGISITLNVTCQKSFNFNCSQCSFVTGKRKGKEKITPFLEILDHVLRLHRQIFQCSHCAKICICLTKYREHMRGHQLKYVCDICGRPLQAKNYLEQHKWTHMNEEEREQAVKEGRKDPRSLRNKIEGTTIQCPTCGKGFNRKGNLKLHQNIHLSEQDRKRVCDNCGKSVNNTSDGWNKHRKLHCTPKAVDLNVFECFKCPKTYSSLELRRQHVLSCHSGKGWNGGEKKVHCEICGKGYISMSYLKVHLQSHGEDRPFECGKGCGMRFKLKATRRNHEKLCDGSGRRPGPKIGKRAKKV